MTMANEKPTYVDLLIPISQEIVATVKKKDKEYGASWKRRGGVGAYMMLVRKSDRLEEQVKNEYKYDIFAAIEDSQDQRETLEDTLTDQIAYGLLILAEIRVRQLEKGNKQNGT